MPGQQAQELKNAAEAITVPPPAAVRGDGRQLNPTGGAVSRRKEITNMTNTSSERMGLSNLLLQSSRFNFLIAARLILCLSRLSEASPDL